MNPTTRTDPRPFLAAALDLATPVIEVAAAGPLHGPTPCGDFDVAALLAHLNSVAARTGAIPTNRIHEVADSLALPPGEYADAWRAVSARVPAAYAASKLDDEVAVPWRTTTLREATGIYAAEVVCHTWDLAVATGQAYDVPPELADVCVAAYEEEIPPEKRAAIFDFVRANLPEGLAMDNDPFGAAVAVGPDATPVERVVAMSGRDPGWRPA